MHIVHVFCVVKPDQILNFKSAIIENAKNSIKEPGIVRFDVIQQQDDPTKFVLVEVYRTEADTHKHKETAHYNKWRKVVEDMLVEPRSRIVYTNVFPDDSDW